MAVPRSLQKIRNPSQKDPHRRTGKTDHGKKPRKSTDVIWYDLNTANVFDFNEHFAMPLPIVFAI